MRFFNLQLLRVVAALGVVGYHLASLSEGRFPAHQFPLPLLLGWWTQVPVPLFFALSGFVLTHAIQKAPPGRFLFARFLRLYPGYWLAMGIGLAIVWHGVWPPDQLLFSKFSTTSFALVPAGPDKGYYVLGGVEWTLIYEVMLSIALTGLSLLGVRRGLPLGVGVWLAVLIAKGVWWPGFATQPFPYPHTILLSMYSVPFLLGVFVYYLRDTGRRCRWLVLAGLVWYVWKILPFAGATRELHWCALAVAGAGAVWFAVQIRQVSPRNPIAQLGDATYGLYLLHFPVIMAIFHRSVLRRWEMGPAPLILLAGGTAICVGLVFGWVESAIHGWLRPLSRLRLTDLSQRYGRLRLRLRILMSPPVQHRG